jgi:hypothetical protein
MQLTQRGREQLKLQSSFKRRAIQAHKPGDFAGLATSRVCPWARRHSSSYMVCVATGFSAEEVITNARILPCT